MAGKVDNKPSSKNWQRHARGKIQASAIINRLQDYLAGKVSMEPGQVTAAKVLLLKVLPDLSSIEGLEEEREQVDPREIAKQVANLIASKPELIKEVLASSEEARKAVGQAMESITREMVASSSQGMVVSSALSSPMNRSSDPDLSTSNADNNTKH